MKTKLKLLIAFLFLLNSQYFFAQNTSLTAGRDAKRSSEECHKKIDDQINQLKKEQNKLEKTKKNLEQSEKTVESTKNKIEKLEIANQKFETKINTTANSEVEAQKLKIKIKQNEVEIQKLKLKLLDQQKDLDKVKSSI